MKLFQSLMFLLLLVSLDVSAVEGEAKAPALVFQTNEDKSVLDIALGDQPLAQYVFAFDDATSERRHETYKPFLHVYDAQGERFITKGPGGQFTHHRGIFLGFNRMQVNDQRYDLWHMKEGVQVHRGLEVKEEDAQFTAEIAWQDNDGKVLLSEKRTFTFLPPPADAYALIEMHSELKAVAGDVELDGDPEHAGAQFRPADDVVAAETQYFFHADGVDPKEDVDLPWVGETFRLATGEGTYSVVIFNHSENPANTRFSAYRDYGRFGAFPVLKIPQDESASLRYRWLVKAGKMPSKAALDKIQAGFAGR